MSTSSAASSSVALARLEASIMSESALIDRELGRVLWESGGSTMSRLSASVAPKLDEIGVAHIKAKVLTVLLLTGLAGALIRLVRSRLQDTSFADKILSIRFLGSFLLFMARMTVLRIPTFNHWFLLFLWTVYILEAYTCSTREYLSNPIGSPEDLESYLERLRNEAPTVTWNVRCFHYEDLSWSRLVQILVSAWNRMDYAKSRDQDTSQPVSPIFSKLRRKVVTHEANRSYQFRHCSDKTVAGIWKRSSLFPDAASAFTKLMLTKLLVLSDRKTREDYMRQQSQFVTEHGQGDEFAEFSTSIDVPGFRPRILAVRPEARTSKIFRLSTFWIFTLFLMTVPYRAWFSNHCDELRVTVVKDTSLAPPRRNRSDNRGWLSAFYSSNNVTTLEEESFRSIMLQARLYGSTSEASDVTDPSSLDEAAVSLLLESATADDVAMPPAPEAKNTSAENVDETVETPEI